MKNLSHNDNGDDNDGQEEQEEPLEDVGKVLDENFHPDLLSGLHLGGAHDQSRNLCKLGCGNRVFIRREDSDGV